jgi:hypothetical protein
MTSPHSHQSGLYCLPMLYLCNETGIAEEGAYKALATLSDEDFAVYDDSSEWVWVCEMAAWQIGKDLSEADKRCKGVQQYLSTLPALPFLSEFINRYANDFHLRIKTSPLQGPSNFEKGASLEQNRTEQEQNRAPEAPSAGVGVKSAEKRGTRITLPFSLTEDLRAWAAKEFPNVDVKAATAEFEDYWRAVPGPKGKKLDWESTWRNRIRELAGRRPRLVNGKAGNPYAGSV